MVLKTGQKNRRIGHRPLSLPGVTPGRYFLRVSRLGTGSELYADSLQCPAFGTRLSIASLSLPVQRDYRQPAHHNGYESHGTENKVADEAALAVMALFFMDADSQEFSLNRPKLYWRVLCPGLKLDQVCA
jgi:hypothetical protein